MAASGCAHKHAHTHVPTLGYMHMPTCIMKMAVLDTLCMAARIRSHAMSEPSTPRYSLMAALSSFVALHGDAQTCAGASHLRLVK